MKPRSTTVRSVSLDTDLALWVEEQAAGENRSVSNFVNTLLGRLRDRAAAPAAGSRANAADAAPSPAQKAAARS